MSRLTVLLASGIALTAFSALASGERVQYALIVAHNGSTDPAYPPLRYADDDGARYHALLAPQTAETILLSVLDAETQAEHPGLAAKTRPPTRIELGRAVSHLTKQMNEDKALGKRPVLFVVYSGHGQRGAAGEGSVTLLDGKFTRSELYEEVLAPAASSAEFVHLIVDACDSYFFVNAKGALPVQQSYAAAVTQFLGDRTLERYPNVGVFLSTSQQAESHEWSAVRGGVFSHQIRSGLAGAADVNGDGRVEYSELRAFMAAATAKIDDVRGKPAVFAKAPALDRSAALADLRQRSELSFVVVPAAWAGRYWVEDHRGVRIAEFHKEPERPVALALPKATTYFLRSATRQAKVELKRSGEVVEAERLAWRGSEDRTLSARGSIEENLREFLFAVPFGPRFYSGYIASSGELSVSLAPAPEWTR